MRKILISASLCVLLGACSQSNNAELAQQFFNEHKIGQSADFGIFADKHELVGAVFGFGDDLKVCEKIVASMNRDEPGIYNCAPLNH